MSRRTADASKAIRLAWEKEQQRVLEGEGTRDWTEKQQQDIIDRGKAYDEDGKAFEGQHMKSAAEYPEFQGEPDNIQFLTHQEHFEAHRGNWQNPTNWYYDPINRQFHDFGDGKYIPCEVIKLSAPICTEGSAVLNENNSTPEKKPVKSEPEIADEIKPETINAEKKTIAAKSDSPRVDSAPITNQSESFIIRGFHKVTDGWKNFRTNHVLADIIQRNGFEGASEKRANTIKILLRDYRTMSGTLRQALMDLGFTITEDGKHYRITYYGDGRYKTTVSKTASDHREGKNIASTIIKNMF